MAVFRYTESAQQFLHAKTKPEPWLHVVTVNDAYGTYYWAIFVWDTRQVVEEGTDYRPMPNSVSKAADNHQQLKGAKEPAITACFDKRWFAINDSISNADAKNNKFGTAKVIKAFKDKKEADAYLTAQQAELTKMNADFHKACDEANKKYKAKHPELKTQGAWEIPEELRKLHKELEKKFKVGAYREPEHNFEIMSAKQLVSKHKELYKPEK